MNLSTSSCATLIPITNVSSMRITTVTLLVILIVSSSLALPEILPTVDPYPTCCTAFTNSGLLKLGFF